MIVKIIKHGLRVRKFLKLIRRSIPLLVGVWIGSKTAKNFGRTSYRKSESKMKCLSPYNSNVCCMSPKGLCKG